MGARRGVLVAAALAALLLAGYYVERTIASGARRTASAQVMSSRQATAGAPGVRIEAPLKVTVSRDRAAAAAVMAKPLPPPGTPFMQIYDDLKARVVQGDHRAACRIGFELERCGMLPMLKTGPDFWRKALDHPNATADKRRNIEKNIESSERQAAEAEKACSGVPDSLTPQTWDYFLAAALAGNGYAIWRVAGFPPGLNHAAREQTLEGWMQWRQYAPSLIEEGVRRGDPRLIHFASRDARRPREGVWLRPEDAVKGVGYQMALLAAAADVYRPTAQRDLDYLLSQTKLDESQLAEARAFAATVHVRAPPGGVDFSRGMDPDRNARQCEDS